LTDAFGVILSCPYADAKSRADAALALSRGAGSFGMVKGQVIDMFGEKNTLTEQELLELHRGKTGALIEAAVRLGCHAAGIEEGDTRFDALVRYAQHIGLAFQVMDDVLDCTQTAEIMGKSVGGDARDQKTTFMTFYDVQGARAYAADLTEKAIAAIKDIAGSENLIALANYLAQRSY
jgi:geranylgeranyl pyrophosphate synthase